MSKRVVRGSARKIVLTPTLVAFRVDPPSGAVRGISQTFERPGHDDRTVSVAGKPVLQFRANIIEEAEAEAWAGLRPLLASVG
jgi:hypothetical protein